MSRRLAAIALLVLLTVPAVAAPAPDFDAERETQKYLDRLTPEQRAKSDAYFEGGYWLQLWSFLYGAVVYGALLRSGISRRMRELASRVTRFANVDVFIYWVLFLLLTTIVFFPLTVYSGFFREHQYGLATQGFGGWMGDQAKGLLVNLVLGGLAIVGLWAILRRATKRWWIYGSLALVGFMFVTALISPVFIAPLFNKYTPLADPAVRGPILQLAQANGIHTGKVYVMDASRQTTRVSANVSGAFGTERITLNDNLLRRTSLPEIRAVLAHEIGHYALNHIYKMVIFFGIVVFVAFAFVKWGSDLAFRRWGERWGITEIGDVASLPLLLLLMSIALFVLTPVTNTIIRVQESEADIFGLNAAREPDGFAEVSLKLAEYRKLAPGPLEEMIFFDHPSGRSRIRMAMQWKAAHLTSP
ncbi:MAG: M48 family metallopeptidase [Thermoanaerobaculia bacterium]